MYVPHTANAEKGIGCGKMSSFDGSWLDSDFFLGRWKLEWLKNDYFFGLWIRRFEYDH